MASWKSVAGRSLSRRPLFTLILISLALISFGTAGFMLVEGWGFLDSVYMTVITVTTVGFEEVQPLSKAGEVFTIFLVVAGVTAGLTAASAIGSALVSNLPGLRKKRMERIAERMTDHVVLCGYGRLGQIVRREMDQYGEKYLIVESSAEVVEQISEEGIPCIQGNATDEAVLKRAGVDQARGVIAAVQSDADNLFITMSARELNPHCAIVARAEDPSTAPKLERVGATSVVTPYVLGGKRLAQAFLHPSAVDLADLAMGGSGEMLIDEVRLPESLPDGMNSLMGLRLGQEFGLIAVGVRPHGQKKVFFNPRAETQLFPGDTLLVMGEQGRVEVFERFLREKGGGPAEQAD